VKGGGARCQQRLLISFLVLHFFWIQAAFIFTFLGRSSRDIFTAIYAKRTGGASTGPAWDAPFGELDVQELLLELEHTLGRDISEADLCSQAGQANMDELANHLTPAQVIELMDQARLVYPALSALDLSSG
jgi:hypothetical protein